MPRVAGDIPRESYSVSGGGGHSKIQVLVSREVGDIAGDRYRFIGW